MKTKLYSIYDQITGVYALPFTAMSPPDAARNVRSAMHQAPHSLIATNPKDYTLFEVGCFNDENGEFECCVPPMFVTHLSQLVVKVEKNLDRLVVEYPQHEGD